MKDPDKITLEVDALKVTQPIGDFFVASMEHEVLIKISYFDVRRVLRDSRDIERYLGIQRPLSEKRVKDLSAYVNFLDATFPSSIILAIDDEYAEYDEKKKKLSIRNFKEDETSPSIAISEVARVLDGQHRIAGLESFKGENFGLSVTIFIGSDIADQGYIFSTVNLEQTKVSKSIVYDLFELARTRSPQRTAHNIAVALDRDEKGPLFERIKRLGFATAGRKFQTLTQATFVENLLPLISPNPKEDRDRLLRNERLEKVEGKESAKLIFRNLFIDEKDLLIARIIGNFFDAIRDRWPDAWEFRGEGRMLNKTNGFRALMRLLPRTYLYFAKPGDAVSKEKFLELFRRVEVSDDYFSVERFKPGSSGEKDLFDFLNAAIFK
ncbi:MAG: DGQHR domain-containing protein [Afipia sp.]|nr:DGQHR domain-containing protein [Afipia sp.]